MAPDALALTLAAALIHAMWNLLLSSAEDTHSATAVAAVCGVLLFAPVAALTWNVHASAAPYAAASSVLEAVYLALLASGYSRAAMSFVYPIARGSAPVFVLVISVLLLGTRVSLAATVGVLVVAAGIVLVRGVRAAHSPGDLALALGVGGCIASYTLVDKHGIVHASALPYLEVVFSATAALYLAGTARLRGPRALWAAVGARPLIAGAGYFGSYVLILVALRLAPAASVAAVRECSVVMATAILAVSGRERVSFGRFVGAVAVVGGIALISVG
jgi:drug/metabolite transporter (DMT)-like permease